MSERVQVISSTLEANRRRLRAFVRSRVPDSEVDDVLQHAAVRAVESAASLRDPSRVLPWLFQIHRNVIIDSTRKRSNRRRCISDADEAPDAAGEGAVEICDCSVHQMRALGDTHGTILALVILGEATLPEAAEALGISVNTATVRLHRAREALKRRMLEHCGVTSSRECYDCRCVSDGCCAA